MVKKYPIVAGLIILLVLLAGFWYFKSPTDTPPDLKTYHNDKYGFEFKYLNDSFYNLQVQEGGSWSRDSIPRLEEICLLRNSVSYNKLSAGKNISLCLTVYDQSVKKLPGFSFQRPSLQPGEKMTLVSEETVSLDNQQATSQEITPANRPQEQVTNIFFERENKIYIISFSTNNIADLVTKNTKRDAELFLQTFRFIK